MILLKLLSVNDFCRARQPQVRGDHNNTPFILAFIKSERVFMNFQFLRSLHRVIGQTVFDQADHVSFFSAPKKIKDEPYLNIESHFRQRL